MNIVPLRRSCLIVYGHMVDIRTKELIDLSVCTVHILEAEVTVMLLNLLYAIVHILCWLVAGNQNSQVEVRRCSRTGSNLVLLLWYTQFETRVVQVSLIVMYS
jgi:hypothetical protein